MERGYSSEEAMLKDYRLISYDKKLRIDKFIKGLARAQRLESRLQKETDELDKQTIEEEVKNIRCSFCGKPQAYCDRIIAGNGAYICDECVGICGEMVKDLQEKAPDEAPASESTPDSSQ